MVNLHRLRRESGSYFFEPKTMALLFVLFIGGFLGSRYAGPYIDKFEIEKSIVKVVENSAPSVSNSQLVTAFERQLKAMGIRDLQAKDFVIERSRKRVVVTVDYAVFIDFGFGKGHTLDFHIRQSAWLR